MSDVLDLDSPPEMEAVKEDLSDLQDNSFSETNDLTPSRKDTAPRRKRGLSFLPVRPQAADDSFTPPKTPSPLRAEDQVSGGPSAPGYARGPSSRTPSGSKPASVVSPGMPVSSSVPHRRTSSSHLASSHLSPARLSPSHRSTSAQVSEPAPSDLESRRRSNARLSEPIVDNNQQKLNHYFSQLASKETRIGNLKATIESLQAELKEAERDMEEFKARGSTELASLAGNDRHDIKEEAFAAGRRVFQDFNSQLKSFFYDVKSATMGSEDFDQWRSKSPVLRGSERQRDPSPHRLSPRRSVQDFVRARSPVLDPITGRSTSPSKQERMEHIANHELRSSVRLSRKLSQVNLKGPHSRSASPSKANSPTLESPKFSSSQTGSPDLTSSDW